MPHPVHRHIWTCKFQKVFICFVLGFKKSRIFMLKMKESFIVSKSGELSNENYIQLFVETVVKEKTPKTVKMHNARLNHINSNNFV